MISPKDRTAWHGMRHHRILPPFALIDVLLFTHPLPVSNLMLCVLCRNWFRLCLGMPWSWKAFMDARSRPAPESAIPRYFIHTPFIMLCYHSMLVWQNSRQTLGCSRGSKHQGTIKGLLHKVGQTCQGCDALEEWLERSSTSYNSMLKPLKDGSWPWALWSNLWCRCLWQRRSNNYGGGGLRSCIGNLLTPLMLHPLGLLLVHLLRQRLTPLAQP